MRKKLAFFSFFLRSIKELENNCRFHLAELSIYSRATLSLSFVFSSSFICLENRCNIFLFTQNGRLREIEVEYNLRSNQSFVSWSNWPRLKIRPQSGSILLLIQINHPILWYFQVQWMPGWYEQWLAKKDSCRKYDTNLQRISLSFTIHNHQGANCLFVEYPTIHRLSSWKNIPDRKV